MAKKINEQKLTNAQGAVRGISRLEFSLFFLLLSNASDSFKLVLSSAASAFQFTSFFLNVFVWLFEVIKFASSANKNLEKTQNLIIATIGFVLTGIIAFGAVALSPAIVTALFFTAISMDVMANLGKSIYFGIKSLIAENPEEEKFFRTKAKNTAINFLMGAAVVSGAILLTVSAPYIGLTAVAALGIGFGVLMAGLAIYSISKAIHKTFFQSHDNLAATEDIPPSFSDDLNNINNINPTMTATLTPSVAPTQAFSNYIQLKNTMDNESILTNLTNKNQIKENPKRTNFYAHSVTSKITLQALQENIRTHKAMIESKINDQNKPNLFDSLEAQKRNDKIKALSFLTNLTQMIYQKDIPNNGNIKILGESFTYSSIDHLKKQVNHFILEKYPDAYQSFFKDVGQVEALFNQAFELIKDKNKLLTFLDSRIETISTITDPNEKNAFIEKTIAYAKKYHLGAYHSTFDDKGNPAQCMTYLKSNQNYLISKLEVPKETGTPEAQTEQNTAPKKIM